MVLPQLPSIKLSFASSKIFLVILVSSVILGSLTGWFLASKGGTTIPVVAENPKNPQNDLRTFKDFANGAIQKRPAPKNPQELVEGSHLLVREGAVPVALTSSVLDLNEFEGKKVKVFGETQKATKEGWLMDIGRVEVEK